MKILSILFAVSIVAVSCEKNCDFKKDKDNYYYSKDYKNSGATILNEEANEFMELWSVFFTEKDSKQLKYKLVGETGVYKEDVVWEEGKVTYDNLNITFFPNDGSPSYHATFSEKKEMYTVVFPGQETRGITFYEGSK